MADRKRVDIKNKVLYNDGVAEERSCSRISLEYPLEV